MNALDMAIEGFRYLQVHTTLKPCLCFASASLVLDIYKFTLLSNARHKHHTGGSVLDIYKFTLLSNDKNAWVGDIAVLDIYKFTLLSNTRPYRRGSRLVLDIYKFTLLSNALNGEIVQSSF